MTENRNRSTVSRRSPVRAGGSTTSARRPAAVRGADDTDDRPRPSDPAPPSLSSGLGAWIGARAEPYVSPTVSARRHWVLIAVVVAAALCLASAVAFVRSPVYTSEARLIVGKTTQLDNLAATPGLSVAGQELAASYSRLMSTSSVQNDIARRLGGATHGSVTATPIPQSPIIRVEATGSTVDRAAAAANAGARSLVAAVNRVNTAQKSLNDELLKEYRTADMQLLQDTQTLQALQAQLAQAGANAGEGLRQQVLAAQTQVDTDTVRVRAIENDFQSALTPGQLDQQIVQRVGSAHGATSDRDTYLEMALIVGLVAGLIVGVVAAVALDKRASGRERVVALEA